MPEPLKKAASISPSLPTTIKKECRTEDEVLFDLSGAYRDRLSANDRIEALKAELEEIRAQG